PQTADDSVVAEEAYSQESTTTGRSGLSVLTVLIFTVPTIEQRRVTFPRRPRTLFVPLTARFIKLEESGGREGGSRRLSWRQGQGDHRAFRRAVPSARDDGASKTFAVKACDGTFHLPPHRVSSVDPQYCQGWDGLYRPDVARWKRIPRAPKALVAGGGNAAREGEEESVMDEGTEHNRSLGKRGWRHTMLLVSAGIKRISFNCLIKWLTRHHPVILQWTRGCAGGHSDENFHESIFSTYVSRFVSLAELGSEVLTISSLMCSWRGSKMSFLQIYSALDKPKTFAEDFFKICFKVQFKKLKFSRSGFSGPTYFAKLLLVGVYALSTLLFSASSPAITISGECLRSRKTGCSSEQLNMTFLAGISSGVMIETVKVCQKAVIS
ncbi:hypothetical protein K474DRAFT_1680952, partial [Panus rudis PR-1116 ss-1]